MGKVNKKMWVDRFVDLDPEDQFDIAKLIVEELGLNEEVYLEDVECDCLDDWPKGYDVEESKKMRETFAKFADAAQNKAELLNLRRAIEGYDTLSEKRKSIVHNKMLDAINNELLEQQYDDRKKICNKEGHLFTEWKHNTWTTSEDGWIDHQLVPNMEHYHENWTRECARCGYTEKTDKRPKRVTEEERKEKINALEAELQALKGNVRVKKLG